MIITHYQLLRQKNVTIKHDATTAAHHVIFYIYIIESIFGFDQSSDFFQLSTNYNKKHIHLESARRDLSNVEICEIS